MPPIAGKTVLVTGANRGLGLALVHAALGRGANRVYAASRRPMIVADERVIPVSLDVTVPRQIAAAVRLVTAKSFERQNAALVTGEPVAG